MTYLANTLAAILLTLALPAAGERPDPDSGTELIGTHAPAWAFDRWVRGPRVELRDLRGKAVLLRWWTERCRFCETTLPELERLRRDHEADGLVVIGVFHPKPPRPVSDRHVIRTAEKLGFHGPVALDQHWKTLDHYWLSGDPERSWTSVSFLIDGEGVIRWVHGGMEYHHSDDPKHHRCDVAMRELEEAVDRLLQRGSPPLPPGR